jgi:hypothetical protein
MINGPVELELPGNPMIFSFAEHDPVMSRYTGGPLRRIEYNLGVRGDSGHGQLEAAVSAAAKGDALIQAADGSRWGVTESQFSWQDGQAVTMYTHNVTFTEHEELDLQRVELKDLVIAPDRFRPETHDHRVSWLILSTFDHDQHQQFEQVWAEQDAKGAESFFPVRLFGVTSEPVQMRFGRCLWQPLDDGRVRHLILLIGEGEDDDEPGLGEVIADVHQPQLNRSVEQALITTAKLNALIDELGQAGVLGADVTDRIRGITISSVPVAAYRELNRTHDIDSFFD